MKLTVHELNSPKDFKNYNIILSVIDNDNPFSKIITCNSQTITNDKNLYYFLYSLNKVPLITMLFYKEKVINTKFYDVSSPYGYSGPLYDNNLSKEILLSFWNSVDTWYKENNIITEFVRFSLNNNHVCYTGNLIPTLNNVRGIILDNEQLQWKKFKPKVRNNYRRAINEGLTVRIYHNNIPAKIVKEFYDIYISTMSRTQATQNYFHSLGYFNNITKHNSNNCLIATVYKDGVPISTELILLSTSTLYSFLGGTISQYFKSRPNDFLKIEVMKWARAKKIKYYVLGGGRKDNDGLYNYKKSFFDLDEDITYYTGRKIINTVVYKKILENKHYSEELLDSITNKETFFPIYRKPNKKNKINVIIDKNKWSSTLKLVGNYDFYHTYDYHHISKNAGEEPILLKYEENDTIIVFPILKRKIDDTKYFDITSVYGYCGPLIKKMGDNFNNSNFLQSLDIYFKDNNIVSVFSRLHPFITHQPAILKGLGEKNNTGQVVSIDLTQDIDIQRSKYSRRTKTHVNKARRNCTVRKAKSKEEIRKYIEIYYENMNRVNANDSYYFKEEYFFNLLNSTDFESEVLIVEHNETKKIIAGAMFVKTNSIVQYHLSGARNEFLDLTPAKLLIDEMRINATTERYKLLNLGGGLGGQIDSLFNFKASFSKDFRDFYILKHIVNHDIYNQLIKEKGIINEGLENDFFPLYRK